MPSKKELEEKQVRIWKEQAKAILVTELLYRKALGSSYYMRAMCYEFNNLKLLWNRLKSCKKQRWMKHYFQSHLASRAYTEFLGQDQKAQGLQFTEVIVATDEITAEDKSRAEYILESTWGLSHSYGLYRVVLKLNEQFVTKEVKAKDLKEAELVAKASVVNFDIIPDAHVCAITFVQEMG